LLNERKVGKKTLALADKQATSEPIAQAMALQSDYQLVVKNACAPAQ
jgi:hypothetical protein